MFSALSPGPRIEYINDTPEVTDIRVEAQFELNYCADPSQTMCQIADSGTPFPCELLL